jgi:hypothetical protein
MAPAFDDIAVRDEQFLIRVLRPEWIQIKESREQPTSESFTDSNQENSCFIEGEIPLEEIRRLFPGSRVARIPVAVVRGVGYSIERRPQPGETPPGISNPNAHVVVGPPQELGRKEYQRRSRAIVRDERVTIL